MDRDFVSSFKAQNSPALQILPRTHSDQFRPPSAAPNTGNTHSDEVKVSIRLLSFTYFGQWHDDMGR